MHLRPACTAQEAGYFIIFAENNVQIWSRIQRAFLPLHACRLQVDTPVSAQLQQHMPLPQVEDFAKASAVPVWA